jgi:nitrite reductase/ring-hydroxylating ferredoxin subunit
VYAFYDQCPHRGIPLSVGRQEFPGTWTCRYHGWTFDNATGVLKAALTDGPDSPICEKVRVRTYPVEERAGLLWVWMGEGAPVPIEEDIPDDFLKPTAVIVGRITVRKGNWRLAAENGYDESHPSYLHRYGAFWTLFSRIPGWMRTTSGGVPQEGWLGRVPDSVGAVGEYPGLGTWPKKRPWKRLSMPARVSIRMPGMLRVRFATYTHWAWYVPIDEERHRYFQLLSLEARGLTALKFRALYWIYRRWLLHVQFNNQDAWMVELMPMTSPERLFRPDASITAWRRLCEHARGELSESEQVSAAEVAGSATPARS